MDVPQQRYVPGVCNIGPAEIALRRRVGVLGAAMAVVVGALLFVIKPAVPWRLVMFFPVAVSAVGFFQSRMHFCVAFGLRGMFNVGPKAGIADTVSQAEFRAKDRKTSQRIIAYSALVGAAAALLAYFL